MGWKIIVNPVTWVSLTFQRRLMQMSICLKGNKENKWMIGETSHNEIETPRCLL